MVIKEFEEAWLEAVERSNSILCAGMDPAEFAMGRTEKGEGLPAGTDKRDWALRYIEAVAPHVAGIKPNMRYWGDDEDITNVKKIIELAHSKGLVVIQDSKEADIGATNDSGIFYAAVRGADAVTLAAFAGNMEDASKQGKDRRIGLISMCLMSNPEYEQVKNMWVNVSADAGNYDHAHIKEIDGVPHVRHYVQLARDAGRFGLAGIVIGAPSQKNHIKDEEVDNAARYFGKKGMALVPGIGAQGGEVTILAKHFAYNHLIANAARGLMFPNGAYSTPEQQAEAAKQYKEILAKLKTN